MNTIIDNMLDYEPTEEEIAEAASHDAKRLGLRDHLYNENEDYRADLNFYPEDMTFEEYVMGIKL